jgi:hypothetical protein
MAGLVGLAVEADPLAAQTASSVSLLGEGIYHGVSVQLPNDGGQWNYNFDQPSLDVQVSGGSPNEVRDTMTKVLSKIHAETVMRQTASGAAPESFVRTTVSQPSIDVFRVQGSSLRATLAVIALGAAATRFLVWIVTVATHRRGRSVPL